MVAFPSFATRLAEIIEENAPQVARKEFLKQKTVKNLSFTL